MLILLLITAKTTASQTLMYPKTNKKILSKNTDSDSVVLR